MIKHICYATDNNYAHLAAVSIMSLTDSNSKIINELSFHILCNDVSQENIDRLMALQDLLNIDIKVYHVDMHKYMKRKDTSSNWPVATYSRLFISEILAEDVDSVLYIDCDTLIVEDISELLNIIMDNDTVIAGCKDIIGDELALELKLPEKYTYINAGVMCLDLEKWRKFNFTDRIVDAYNSMEKEPKYCDQELINWELRDYIRPLLSYKYNAERLDYFYPEFYKAKKVVIIHYLAGEYRCRRKDLMALVMHYYNQSPWQGMEIPDNRTTRERIIRTIQGWLEVNCKPLSDVCHRTWILFKKLKNSKS